MQTVIDHTADDEAKALAKCYTLLLQKAQERRQRLERETAVQFTSEGNHALVEKGTASTNQVSPV